MSKFVKSLFVSAFRRYIIIGLVRIYRKVIPKLVCVGILLLILLIVFGG